MMEQTLAAVPLFVFMGIMMEQANLMERLFDAVQKMLSRLTGALYLAVMFVATIFAAATGIVGASVTILGIMAGKSMIRSGYDVQALLGPHRRGRHARHPDPALDHAGGDGAGARGAGDDALRRGDRARAACWRSSSPRYAMIRCWINPALGPPLPIERAARRAWREVWKEFLLGLVPPAALVLVGARQHRLRARHAHRRRGVRRDRARCCSPPPTGGSPGATSRTRWSRRSRSRC